MLRVASMRVCNLLSVICCLYSVVCILLSVICVISPRCAGGYNTELRVFKA